MCAFQSLCLLAGVLTTAVFRCGSLVSSEKQEGRKKGKLGLPSEEAADRSLLQALGVREDL